MVSKTTIIGLVLFCCLLIGPVQGRAETLVIENGFWRVGFSRQTGEITELSARSGEGESWCSLLPDEERGAGAGVVVYDVAGEKTYRAGDPQAVLGKITGEGNRVVVKQVLDMPGEKISLQVRYDLDGSELRWDAVLKGDGEGNRSLRPSFELPLTTGFHLWSQTRPDLIDPAAGNEFSLWYVRAPEGYDKFDNKFCRHDLTLPMVVLMNREAGLGVTLAHPVDNRRPSSGFVRTDLPGGGKAIQAVTALMGLRGRKPLETNGYLVAHKADYRPGLGWMFNRWPEYFLPEPGIHEKGAIYSIGGPLTGIRNPDGSGNWETRLDYGATFFEFHGGYFPWYGMYFPKNIETAVWADVQKVERGKAREDSVSFDLIKRRLKNLAGAGFDIFYYFEISDGYPPEVERRWPDAVARWPGGRPALSGWSGGGIDYRLMNADTAYSYGKDLVRQIDGIIDRVEPKDGIFFDCVHQNGLDFAHDDGVTLVYLNGQSVPAYSINFCYDFFLDRVSKKLHSKGQYLFINGPTSIRNGKGVDAVMLEGRGAPDWEYEFEYSRFLSCMARPMIWFLPRDPFVRREILLQRCLLYGAYPSAPRSAMTGQRSFGDDKEDHRLWKPYIPLYGLLRGRVLCFEPDPLTVPLGYRGEVFTMPDGGYALTLINENMSVFDRVNRDTPVLELRLDKKVGRVMLHTPGEPQGKEIPYTCKDGSGLKIEIPDFRGAAVLLLSPAE